MALGEPPRRSLRGFVGSPAAFLSLGRPFVRSFRSPMSADRSGVRHFCVNLPYVVDSPPITSTGHIIQFI